VISRSLKSPHFRNTPLENKPLATPKENWKMCQNRSLLAYGSFASFEQQPSTLLFASASQFTLAKNIKRIKYIEVSLTPATAFPRDRAACNGSLAFVKPTKPTMKNAHDGYAGLDPLLRLSPNGWLGCWEGGDKRSGAHAPPLP
jgi:hypothetical protein